MLKMEAEIEELKIALHAEHPTITVRVLYSYTLKGEDTEEKKPITISFHY